jgi:hypothetical protein
MKLKDYEFEANIWPPPKEEQNPDSYLFGFDLEHQPYILRWETLKGCRGWCGSTVEGSLVNSNVTASPRYLDRYDVERQIKWWAKAPMLRVTIDKYS